MSQDNALREALLKEVAELPDPKRRLLTHNERALIDLCHRLAAALATPSAGAPDVVPGLERALEIADGSVDGVQGLIRQLRAALDAVKGERT